MALQRSSIIVFGLILLFALLAALFLAGGSAVAWRQFGPPDLGEVDFATLERRRTPNDALACRPGLCAARADFEAPTFDMPARELMTLFQQAIAAEPRLERVGFDAEAHSARYVQRSRWLGFPDTINVKAHDLGDGRSALTLYSRSQLGRADAGVNRARLKRWIGLVEELALGQ